MSRSSTLPAPQAPAWRDHHRWWWLLSPAFPALVWLNLWKFQLSGLTLWLWMSSLVTFVLIPLLDVILGSDTRNPPETAVKTLENDGWYRAIVVAFLPFQFGLTLHGAWLATHAELSLWGWAGLVLSVGGINGVAINTAHELGHKLPRWERWLARLALAPACYGHFYIEHNRGHHLRVATPEDPASSRMGESFWAFLPRTMLGSLRSAWQLEAERLDRQGRPALHWRNACLQAWAMSALLFGGLVLWLGWAVLPFLLIQAFYGASLLEVVNYIEHYGLLRPLDAATGRPVRCAPEHSWNSSHRVSNLFLYQLQRHSDHHAHPGRRYQALRHFSEAPQLPSGYAAMLLLAYLPPLWFRVMDRRVLAHYGGDLRRANLQPNRRQALLERYPPRPAPTDADLP
ncbi:alkane 1-monooxygenase [Paucibacter sp. APW11]|uniref:Alkane 1-monooxygenase n=1 Tax=Roseateles aquae TaxID=3077235 RepID=A0ABU3PBV9_9BURK|nr:alkane 1-monooxygenase [Paucibacter sp. APW11]MDT9000003.1 alkane 1-monooxygenase [Paucibacter sp. APW11]